MFEGVAGSNYKADIALDDISITDGACTATKLCDFEVDRCGYTNVPGYNMQWYRGQNGTSSVGTGPSFDHTTNSGRGRYCVVCITCKNWNHTLSRTEKANESK